MGECYEGGISMFTIHELVYLFAIGRSLKTNVNLSSNMLRMDSYIISKLDWW